MHARYYSPLEGRFLSVDPGGFDPRLPQSWNRYSYVLNNPLKAIDPNDRETYVVVAGNGAVGPQYQGMDHDQGRQFQIAAQTRANEIRASGVLGKGDGVVVMNASNIDEFTAAATSTSKATR